MDEGRDATCDAGCPAHLAAAIEALRTRGAPHVQPLRFHLVEALARRAAVHEGKTRRLLEEKLARHLSACSDALDQASTAEDAAQSIEASPRLLAGLLEALSRQTEPEAEAAAALGDRGGRVAEPVELKTLRAFRSTWTRLRLDQQLTQSLAAVPQNAGPLNSYGLLHRALELMRQASPQYLQHFIAYQDALAWLEQASAAGAHQADEAARRPAPDVTASRSRHSVRKKRAAAAT